MNFFQSLLFFFVSFLASIAGAICGIGGGVIIKPTLDLFGWSNVTTISFLSGCTVLSMSCYSVSRSIFTKDNSIKLNTGTPLAIGAAIGGVTGNQLFSIIKSIFKNPNTIGAVQAGCLCIITIGTLLYTLHKEKIRVLHVQNKLLCLAIGLFLGIMSSFLGIGGGPINLVVLYYFFGMNTKTAAANSLYIILFSQISNLFTTVISGNVPEFDIITLILMISGGIFGGIIGRKINKHINSKSVDKLFICLMVVIIIINIYNIWKYTCL